LDKKGNLVSKISGRDCTESEIADVLSSWTASGKQMTKRIIKTAKNGRDFTKEL
jgi:hypothetical protein